MMTRGHLRRKCRLALIAIAGRYLNRPPQKKPTANAPECPLPTILRPAGWLVPLDAPSIAEEIGVLLPASCPSGRAEIPPSGSAMSSAGKLQSIDLEIAAQ
jgi:hypothetical protein